MMKQLIIIFSICLSYSLQGQIHSCGTHFDGGEDFEILKELEQSITYKNDEIINFPVSIHIIGSPPNSNFYLDILEQLEIVNENFKDLGFRFVSCEPYYIGGPSSVNASTNGYNIAEVNHIPGTVNIYFCNQLFYMNNGEEAEACGLAYYPWWSVRRIFMANSCLEGGTFEHEIGHYFGLYHTHEEGQGREFANGSNCSTSGDLLCDTPADPNLYSGVVNANCDYVGNSVDPNGESYRPDVSNYMSYAPDRCTYRFSSAQLSKMRIYMNRDLEDLNIICGEADLKVEVLDEPDYKFGQEREVQILVTNSELEERVETVLQVSLDRSQSIFQVVENIEISIEPGEELQIPISISIPDRIPSGEYLLSFTADPSNDFKEINKTNNKASFTVVSSHRNKQSGTLFPNPASDFTTAFFQKFVYAVDKPVQIDIFDQMGQLIRTEELYDVSGPELFINISTAQLPQGVYIVNFNWPDGKSEALRFVKVE